MSKIYEALQRAEQERLARQTVTPTPAAVEDLPETLTHEALPESRTSESGAYSTPQPAAFPPPQPLPVEQASAALAQGPATPPTEAPAYARSYSPAEAAPVVPPPLAPTGPAAPSDAGATFGTGRIAAREWKPLLEKLPALELRGGPVEQFRSLRSRLFAFRDMNKLKTVLVTSGLPREGKSFITANLAVSFARHKNTRVLLIDGDMRRSSLHTLLGCDSKPGLSTYLAGKATAQEVMQRGRAAAGAPRLPAGLEQLTFIGGGDEGDKAADLAGSARFGELLAEAEQQFDWIIIDSSPVNLVTDGVNLAHSCDGVLLVVRQGVTPFPVAQRALGELKASRMLGVVLNAATIAPGTDGYYGYNGYDSYDSKTPPAVPGPAENAGA